MFEKDEEGHIAAKHHPFCSIKEEDKEKFLRGEDLMSIRANAYDLVLNGLSLVGQHPHSRAELQSDLRLVGGVRGRSKTALWAHVEAFTFGARRTADLRRD